MGLASREIVTYLDFHSSEQMRSTLRRWALGNFAAVAIALSQPLEGPFANSGEFVDLRVRETLEGHRQGHLFEVIGYVTANHPGERSSGGRGW